LLGSGNTAAEHESDFGNREVFVGAQAEHFLIGLPQTAQRLQQSLLVGVAHHDALRTGIGMVRLATDLLSQGTEPPSRPPEATHLVASNAVRPGQGLFSIRHVVDPPPSHHKDLRGGVIGIMGRQATVAIAAHRVVVLAKDAIESHSARRPFRQLFPPTETLRPAYVRIAVTGYI
jgi:hypothetical protein